LIIESVTFGYLIYQQKNQPEYLMTMPIKYWSTLDSNEREVIVDTLFRYSKTVNPAWESRVMYFYENKGLFKILFIKGRVETMPIKTLKKEKSDV
jgi:hypothetical protein